MHVNATAWVRLASIAACFALCAACGGAGDETGTNTSVAGYWRTADGAQTTIQTQLAQTGSSVSGTGTITTPALAPISGPANPAYTGDDFTITSGSFSSPNVSFTATLGANPDSHGGFFRGTLTFTGTVSGNTMSGTLTYTPPRTVDQVFAAQSVPTVTLTKPS